MSAWPVLISIPHGGTQQPPELADLVVVSREGLAEEIDHLTREIFSLPEACTLTFPWARTFVDLNRRPEQLPPADEDGIVKLRTCTGERVLAQVPAPELLELMLERYYRPYHRELERLLASGQVRCALDCHSMAAVGPLHSPDPGRRRPLVCLGNRFGESAPDELMEDFGTLLAEHLELPRAEVVSNLPYCGGYITRHYGHNPVPWIQIELSRGLYLDGGLYDGRLELLNQRFGVAVRAWLNC